jgi:hypothetical protein
MENKAVFCNIEDLVFMCVWKMKKIAFWLFVFVTNQNINARGREEENKFRFTCHA